MSDANNDALIAQNSQKAESRAIANLQAKLGPVATETPAPTTPSTSDTVAETAKAIVQAAQGDGEKPAPAAEAQPPAAAEVDAATKARREEQARRLAELRQRSAARREADERARSAEQAKREAELRAKELEAREAKLKEQEESWRESLHDPVKAYQKLGLHPEQAFERIAKTMGVRNEKVELTSAQWEAVERKIAELEEKAAKKGDLEPANKRVEELEARIKSYEEERQKAEYSQKRSAAEQQFVGIIQKVSPELLVEYGEQVVIGLGDQLANHWLSQGNRHWDLEELALELKSQHDSLEQAKSERRAKYQPATSPPQQAQQAPPARSASSQESGKAPKAAPQTLTNDLSASTGAVAKTNLSRSEREKLTTDKLQARMNAARR